MRASTRKNCCLHRSWPVAASLPPATARRPIRRTPAPISASLGSDQHLLHNKISTVLTAFFLTHTSVTPLLIPTPSVAATAASSQIVSNVFEKQEILVASAPDVDAETANTQTDQQWWQDDADAWLELTTPSELSAFLNSSQSAPAWPYLTDDQLAPKLKVVEFYATWCPACRAAAPGMAAVAKDPQLQPTCTFARADAGQCHPTSHGRMQVGSRYAEQSKQAPVAPL